MSDVITSICLTDLPALGAALAGGTFAGLTTRRDGTHAAVILLDDKPSGPLPWQAATDWAASQAAELPTRPVAALLFANLKPQFEEDWHWTADEYSASYAWYCTFSYGDQGNVHKSAKLCARAVRLISLAG